MTERALRQYLRNPWLFVVAAIAYTAAKDRVFFLLFASYFVLDLLGFRSLSLVAIFSAVVCISLRTGALVERLGLTKPFRTKDED
jgi:hypothetical protein